MARARLNVSIILIRVRQKSDFLTPRVAGGGKNITSFADWSLRNSHVTVLYVSLEQAFWDLPFVNASNAA